MALLGSIPCPNAQVDTPEQPSPLEEREVLQPKSEVLYRRAKAQVDPHPGFYQLRGFDLRITGIVVTPPGQPNRAIINDRIYEDGQTGVVDGEGIYLQKLRVVEIERSIVRFCYEEDMEFARELPPGHW